jgi:general secretion pathway protein K
VALVSVIWGVALLSVIAVSFLWTGNASRRLARNGFDVAQIEAVAEAAINRAVLGLLEPRPEARWRADGTPYEFSFDGARIEVQIQDELGRIDLNRADGSVLISLLQSAGLDPRSASSLVDKILDWREASPFKRLNGAKERDYRDAGYAYRPRNGAFQSLDELKLVMGMTPELFRRVEPALTIYSGRPTLDPQVAPRAALLALPTMDESKIAALIAARAGPAPFSALPLQGRAFAVSARIETPVRTIGREAVIRMTDNPVEPFWILSWKAR